MKYIVKALAIAILALTATSCNKIRGEGPTVSETRSHRGFTSISSSVDADVIFTQGQDYHVEITAQQNIIERMKSDVSGGELRFYFADCFNIGHHDPIKIYVTAPNVTGFTINGSGDLRSSDLEMGDKAVHLKVNGSGSMYFTAIYAGSIDGGVVGSGNMNIAAGEAAGERCDISGSGTIDFNNLLADRVTTNTTGSGSTSVYAKSSLDVSISGSGNVYYRGTPRITSNISGSGNIRPY